MEIPNHQNKNLPIKTAYNVTCKDAGNKKAHEKLETDLLKSNYLVKQETSTHIYRNCVHLFP